jgi:hypothetical protein
MRNDWVFQLEAVEGLSSSCSCLFALSVQIQREFSMTIQVRKSQTKMTTHFQMNRTFHESAAVAQGPSQGYPNAFDFSNM